MRRYLAPHKTAARLKRSSLSAVLVLISATAHADEYRPPRSAAVPVELEVREWNSAYTLDIPADLSNRHGGNAITYAPAYGAPYGQSVPQVQPRLNCPTLPGSAYQPGCPALQPTLAFPPQQSYRRR